ncbi:MAG: hypothetical protein PHX09_04015 [Clostridia bacterium]|nr:hypothetical protein [Clostridia bacterium]MDD4685810.1 hypothetical protein [Clostridia bacterium]
MKKLTSEHKKINQDLEAESFYEPTQTDKEFKWVLDFIKERDFSQMQDVIKINFNYLKNNNLAKFNLIVNYYNEYKHLWGEINFEKGIYELGIGGAQGRL